MTFTQEQLINQAREEVDFWRERDELIPSQQTAIRLRLAEIAMAALMTPKQEPVADVVAWSSPSEERTCDIRWRRHDVKPGPLYTAPPAPVVDADDNFYSWFGREWHRHYQQNHFTTEAKQMLGVMAESAWKAGRRAAMLQGAEPVQEWIPCSERMPEKMVSVLATGDWFDYAVTAWDGGAWLDFDDYEPPVTHWMPLPKQPQQNSDS